MEFRTFDPANPPDWIDPEHWRDTPNCNHLDSDNGVHRARLQGAAEAAASMAKQYGLDAIVDLGAGDGGLLSLLPSALAAEQHSAAYWGYELIEDSVQYARNVRRVPVLQANIQADRDSLMWGLVEAQPKNNLVIMTEVLEHMADPHAWLRNTIRWKTAFVVASSPHSETATNHEWNHAWVWDRDGYRDLFEANGFEVLEQADVEWSQMIIARPILRTFEWQGNSDFVERTP